jgi:hypothetical protein
MKVIWLNDSLVLRGENREEKQALSVVFNALEPKEPDTPASQSDEPETTSPLAMSSRS